MVYVSDGSAAQIFRELGGKPGTDSGHVIVTMISPPQEIHAHTTQVTVLDLGVVIHRPQGRLFVPSSNVSSISDAPEPEPSVPGPDEANAGAVDVS